MKMEDLAEEDQPMIRAIQLAGIYPLWVYMTTALKCQPKAMDLVEPKHSVPCLENFLGPELECVEPAVIWVTGRIGMNMVRRHLHTKEIPQGGMVLIEAPKIWRFDRVLIVRSPHPNRVLCNNPPFDNLLQVANLVGETCEWSRRR